MIEVTNQEPNQIENNELEDIDFDKLIQEAKELCSYISASDELGLKINEMLKAFTNLMGIQATQNKELLRKLNEKEQQYNHLKEQYDDLYKDYELVFEANKRKSELLEIYRDNDD